MTTETTDHRAILNDLYDDLQLYREADFDLEQTGRAVQIAGRTVCAIQQLADPTPAQKQATEDLVRALWAWQEAQVEPTPEAEASTPTKWDGNGLCTACKGRGQDGDGVECPQCNGYGDRNHYEYGTAGQGVRKEEQPQ